MKIETLKNILYTYYLFLKAKECFVFLFVFFHSRFCSYKQSFFFFFSSFFICRRCVLNIAYLPRWINLNHTRTRTVFFFFFSFYMCVQRLSEVCVTFFYRKKKTNNTQDETEDMLTKILWMKRVFFSILKNISNVYLIEIFDYVYMKNQIEEKYLYVFILHLIK